MRTPAGAAGIVCILAVACATATAARTPAQTGELLYVCIQDEAKVAVVDMDTRSLLRTIDFERLGYGATAKPHYIVVDPDGSNWYVSLIGANRVLKLDRRDSIVGQFEMETPGMLALGKVSDFLVVSRSMSAVNPPSRVAVLRRSSMSGDELDVIFPRPHPMAVSSAGYAYTGSLGVNQLASIKLDDEKVSLTRIDGPQHSLVQFVLSPDERTLAASTDVSGRLLVFDLADPAKPALRASVTLGAMAFDPAFTPDGRFVYVPVKSRNEIAVIETEGWTVVSRITHPSILQPQQVVFSADGTTAFVSNNNKMDHMADPLHAAHEVQPPVTGTGALVVIDTRSREVVKTIELGRNLTGMGTRAKE